MRASTSSVPSVKKHVTCGPERCSNRAFPSFLAWAAASSSHSCSSAGVAGNNSCAAARPAGTTDTHTAMAAAANTRTGTRKFECMTIPFARRKVGPTSPYGEVFVPPGSCGWAVRSLRTAVGFWTAEDTDRLGLQPGLREANTARGRPRAVCPNHMSMPSSSRGWPSRPGGADSGRGGSTPPGRSPRPDGGSGSSSSSGWLGCLGLPVSVLSDFKHFSNALAVVVFAWHLSASVGAASAVPAPTSAAAMTVRDMHAADARIFTMTS